MKFNLFSTVLILLISPLSAFAQEEPEGSKDHPVFPRMPNYYIYEYDEKEFDVFEMPNDSKDSEKTERIEGHKISIRYMLKEGAKSAGKLQISRNYSNAIQKSGGSIVATGENESTTLKLNQNGKEIWSYIEPSDGEYNITIVERQAMKQDITAGQLIEALEKEGHVALYINFDTGKDVIKPESASIMEQVTKMLKDNPTLNIIIEGHTDSTGDAEGNQRLSEMRATAVKNAVVKSGIETSRLNAIGYGRTKPIADNNTEDGRAKNRRVEIVKKK
jgi:OmpA-OmpF porin, OOP family